MAPLIQLDDLGSGAPVTLTPVPTAGDQTSRAAMMQLIYQLMLLIGENMSKLQAAQSQLQEDQETIAQAQATGAQVNAKNMADQLEKIQEEQQKAKLWDVLKYIGAAIALAVGGLLCSTGVGFLLLAAVTAFVSSPLFTMATTALATAIQNADPNMSSTWANIIAQVIVLVIVIVVSLGTEAAASAVRAATTVGEDVGTTALTDASDEVVDELTQDAVEELGENTTNTQSTSSKPTFTNASTQAILQTLMASNLVPELVDEIPGAKKHPWIGMLVSIIVQILATIATMNFSSVLESSDSFLSTILTKFGLASKVGQSLVQGGIQLTGEAFNATGSIGGGINLLNQSKFQKALAPIEAQLSFMQGFSEIMTQLSSQAQESSKQTMKALEGIFNINFSADMQACVQAQQSYQG